MPSPYTVIRTDLMSAVAQPADLVSLRFYDGSSEEAEVENGTIVKLSALEDGEREVWKAVAAAATDDPNDCVIVASVELMYDERKRNLDDFINEAGTIARGYRLRNHNIFSVTKEGFVSGTAPDVGDTVGIGANGKIAAEGTGLGTCIAVETAGRYTYYVIEIGKVAPSSGD